ncbi:MAG: MgtC/SapB family protein [Prevotella sp.]|nr:MgtC/SapB family protein [Prevotella sp.]
MELTELFLRLSVALLLGGIIGFEREYRSKDAGFRTHFLVSLGSALFCLVSQYGFGDGLKDASRVAAQVVSGIGFLGAGTIIFQKSVVRGLTTAAGLWVTAAIGLACGSGMYVAALVGTVLILFGLEILNEMIPQISTTTVMLAFTSHSREEVKRVMDEMKRNSIKLYSYELKTHRAETGELFKANLELKVKRGQMQKRILEAMEHFDDVTISIVE